MVPIAPMGGAVLAGTYLVGTKAHTATGKQPSTTQGANAAKMYLNLENTSLGIRAILTYRIIRFIQSAVVAIFLSFLANLPGGQDGRR